MNKKNVLAASIAMALMAPLTLLAQDRDEHRDRRDQPQPRQEQRQQPRDHHDQQPRNRHDQPQQRDYHAQPQQREQHMQPMHDRHDQPGRGPRDMRRPMPGGDPWAQHRAQHWDNEHRDWAARGGYRGERIPDPAFRRRWGRDHPFRLGGVTVRIYGGHPRFRYGGYYVSVVDPVPEYWGDDWRRNDDIYVDYVNGGYYMFNRRFPSRPGVAISISVR